MINELLEMGMYRVADKTINTQILNDLKNIKAPSLSIPSGRKEKPIESIPPEKFDEQLDVLKRTESEIIDVDRGVQQQFTVMQQLMEKQAEELDKRDDEIFQLSSYRDEFRTRFENGIHIDTMEDQAYDNLITRMRESTFRVHIVDAFRDIVEPLTYAMTLLNEDSKQQRKRHQFERISYLSNINDALIGMGGDQKDLLNRLTFNFRQFMRQPLWFTLTKAATSIVSIFAGTAWKILFGLGRKRETVQEKTLKAIQQQTEFLRTGQIESTRPGFVTRLFQQGIAGMGIRGVGRAGGSLLGISSGEAQNRENARAAGQEVSNSISGFLSDFLYKDEVTRKGRQGGILGARAGGDSSSMVEVVNIPDFWDEYFKLHNQARLIDMGKAEIMHKEQMDVLKKNTSNTTDMLKFNHHTKNYEKRAAGVLVHIDKNTKNTVNETKAMRRQMFVQNLMNFMSSMLGNAINALNAGVNMMRGFIGTVTGLITRLPWGKLGAVARGARAAGGAVASGTSRVRTAGVNIVSGAKDAVARGARAAGGAVARGARVRTAGVNIVSGAKDAVARGARAAGGAPGAKAVLKRIPGVGLVLGTAFGVQRLMQGDIAGAGMEVASGALSTIPGLGTVGSAAIDGALYARDSGAFSSNTQTARPLHEPIPEQYQGYFSNFETPSIAMNQESNLMLNNINTSIKELHQALLKQQSQNEVAPEFGHDRNTMLNIYGAE